VNTSSYIKDDHDVYESQELEIESVRAYNMTSFRFAGLLLQACSRLETKPDSIPAKNKDSNKKNRKQSGPNTNQMVAQLLAPSMQVNRAGSTQFAWFLGRIITGKPVLTCERYSASVASSSLQ
jgi:alpha-amylase/alpha-mannosidase (GH57 family)